MEQRSSANAAIPSRRAPAPADETTTFAATFVAEYQTMVALAAAVSGDRIHAEDLAQEAMVRLEKNWDRVQHFDKPGAWLRRVTINLALSQRRRKKTELKALLRLDKPEPQVLEVDETDEEIWAHVARLPKMQRAVISLQYLEDLKPDEIAEILEVETTTVRVHQHRARQQLRKHLGSRQALEATR